MTHVDEAIVEKRLLQSEQQVNTDAWEPLNPRAQGVASTALVKGNSVREVTPVFFFPFETGFLCITLLVLELSL